MATAKTLDKEDSPHDRPQRPRVAPPGAPNSPVVKDPPLTPGEKQAMNIEAAEDDGEGRIPAGGLPDGIPHGDERPGAKPYPKR